MTHKHLHSQQAASKNHKVVLYLHASCNSLPNQNKWGGVVDMRVCVEEFITAVDNQI
jgi:hypothetical protein